MFEFYTGPLEPDDQPEVRSAFTSDEQDPEWEKSLEIFSHDITTSLLNEGIPILGLRSRLKSPQRIREKLAQNGIPNWPLADIYGLRVILSSKGEISRAILILRNQYPTPEEFPWGLKTLRTWGNSHSHPDYNITRMNLVFSNKIAELQLLTPEQDKINKETRAVYEKNRKKE